MNRLTATGGHRVLRRVDRPWNGRVSAGRRAGNGRDAVAGARPRRSGRGGYRRPDRRRAPVHGVEGASSRVLRAVTGARPCAAGGRRHRVATRPSPRRSLQLLLRRADGGLVRHRGHGPARDGCRNGGYRTRTSRTGRWAHRASHRSRRRRRGAALDRASRRNRLTHRR